MNESEWWGSDDPVPMLVCVRNAATTRKLRLFACACCRQAWNPFVQPIAVAAVEVIEAVADGHLSASVLARVHAVMTRQAEIASHSTGRGMYPYGYDSHICRCAAMAALPTVADAARLAALAAAYAANDSSAWTNYSGYASSSQKEHEFGAERAEQAELARDNFGNPFRPVEFDPAWLTPDVLAMAKVMYASRDFSAMPILADALQDAGCDEDDVLIHCREDSAIHARGCWVVDLLLGKN
jgi:hypothetical protein